MKKKLLVMLLLVISLGVWGCVPNEGENHENENTQTEAEKEKEDVSEETQSEETFDDDLYQSVPEDEDGVYTEDEDGLDDMTENDVKNEPDSVEVEFDEYDEETTE